MTEFRVDRVSLYNNEQPCEEAYQKQGQWIEENSPNAYRADGLDAMKGTRWLEEGRNHRVTPVSLLREVPDTGWFIQLNSLEELIAFVAKYGEVILYPDNGLTIYDGYIE